MYSAGRKYAHSSSDMAIADQLKSGDLRHARSIVASRHCAGLVGWTIRLRIVTHVMTESPIAAKPRIRMLHAYPNLLNIFVRAIGKKDPTAELPTAASPIATGFFVVNH